MSSVPDKSCTVCGNKITETKWEVQRYDDVQHRYHIDCCNCVKCGRNMYQLRIMSDPDGSPTGPSCYDCSIPSIVTNTNTTNTTPTTTSSTPNTTPSSTPTYSPGSSTTGQ
ncbi:uncharacterized protein LOC142336924 [Convolutriloba macropyga]|uniref:uncharacterized protein LOC142336924 n=1 Tax=Convolutriloba macropyga TaxID=536237 RepID=UPI003F5253C5